MAPANRYLEFFRALPPSWGSSMACDALARSGGEHVIYVGEWMGGSADARFFAMRAARFEAIEVVAIPRWYGRTDQLIVFRRRSTGEPGDVLR